MSRVKSKRLRGSVMQNNTSRKKSGGWSLLFKIRVLFVLATIGFFLLTILWMWLSGWAAHQVNLMADAGIRLTQRAHFAVKDVVVEGREYTDRDELIEALGVKDGSPILIFSPSEAHEKVLGLPWVADAVIERRLPDTIYVRLVERQPMARWQHDNVTVVIDNKGKTIPGAKPEEFSDLLLVAGDSAPEETKELLRHLKQLPNIMGRTQSAVRVGERRWNLYFQSGQVVRLPEDNMADALKRLDDLISTRDILNRKVTGIDMRLPDRVILEPIANVDETNRH